MRAFFLLLVLTIRTCVLGEDISVNSEGEDYTKQARHLKNVDLKGYVGVRIPKDKSFVTMGKKGEIQLFRYLFVFHASSKIQKESSFSNERICLTVAAILLGFCRL